MIPYEDLKIGMEMEARGLVTIDNGGPWLPAIVIQLYPNVARYPVKVRVNLGDGYTLTGERALDELRLKPKGGKE